MKFKVNSKNFNKFLKAYKLDKSLYITVKADKILLKNIDFKQCMGVLVGQYYCDNSELEDFSFKVDYIDIINKLDNFKNDVFFVVDPLQNILKLVDPENQTYEFILGCDTGPHVNSYANLELIPDWEKPDVKFELDHDEALNCFKMITTVEHIIHFRLFPSKEKYPVQLISKKISNIGVKKLTSESIKSYSYQGALDCIQYQVYFSPYFFNLVKESTETLWFYSYEDYLVLETSSKDPKIHFKVYIPKKAL